MGDPSAAELIELLVDGGRYGDAEDIQSAIDHGVDVNSQDEHGRTGAAAPPPKSGCPQPKPKHCLAPRAGVSPLDSQLCTAQLQTGTWRC